MNILRMLSYLEFLSVKGGCIGLSESTLVKMPHCWKSRVVAHMFATRLCMCILDDFGTKLFWRRPASSPYISSIKHLWDLLGIKLGPPQGFWGSRENGYLFSGIWGALVIILGELRSKLIVLGDLGSPAKKQKKKKKRKKGKVSILFDFLKISSASGGGGVGVAPKTPLVNYTCIHFHITCTSRLIWKSNMAIMFGCCWFTNLKIVDF